MSFKLDTKQHLKERQDVTVYRTHALWCYEEYTEKNENAQRINMKYAHRQCSQEIRSQGPIAGEDSSKHKRLSTIPLLVV